MRYLKIPRRPAAIVATVVLLCAFVSGGRTLFGPGQKHGVAYFSSVTSIYPKDKVRILGVPVGQIDKITPQENAVRVDFSYDGRYSLPADVKAAIVSPTLVATRFLQLAPAYTTGATLADGGTIPESRTAAPLEFDALKSELVRISQQLGPQRQGDEGALAQFLSVSASAARGHGYEFRRMVTSLSAALKVVSQGRGDLFGTVRNLQVFISAMAGLDSNMVSFNRRLAGVSGLLDDNGKSLQRAITGVDGAARILTGFLARNRPVLGSDLHKLGALTTMLAGSRDDLATALHIGPNALTNVNNIYSSRINAYTGALAVGNLGLGQVVCALVATQLEATGDATCTSYLAPLLSQVHVNSVPVGTGPVVEQPQPVQSSSDPGTNEGTGPVGGLLGLLGQGASR